MNVIASNKATTPVLSRAILGSLVGGMIFGMLMQMMNMITAVAMLINSKSTAVGWILHLAISMIFGVIYFALGSSFPIRVPSYLVGGIYGLVLWVVGALVLMPAKLGMPLFNFDSMAWKSLMGHLIFGVVLAIVSTPKIKAH